MAETNAKAQCLCGQIQYSVKGPLGEVRYCHCLRCRQATGTAFSTNARISSKHFQIEMGTEHLNSYEMGPGIHRHFCSCCGSPIYVSLDYEPGFVRPRIGAFAEAPDVNITAHVWVGSKADWHEITDSLPQYNEAKRVE